MLSSLLRSALVLAAVCCLTNAESVITCENGMQRLSCGVGVVIVLTVTYKQTNNNTCIGGKASGQVASTACSPTGALAALAKRCNGTQVCEVDKAIFGANSCPATHQSIQITYKCLTASESCHSVKYCNTGPPCVCVCVMSNQCLCADHFVASEGEVKTIECGRIHEQCITMCSAIKTHISSSPARLHV
uniref:SUEL-type lectin domain-containing protein n=1 Tax=Gadus morhua TaxID=8049 RepID=A0A8C5FB76_GADMO